MHNLSAICQLPIECDQVTAVVMQCLHVNGEEWRNAAAYAKDALLPLEYNPLIFNRISILRLPAVHA